MSLIAAAHLRDGDVVLSEGLSAPVVRSAHPWAPVGQPGDDMALFRLDVRHNGLLAENQVGRFLTDNDVRTGWRVFPLNTLLEVTNR